METDLTPIGELVEYAIGGGWGDEHAGEQPVTIVRGTDLAGVRSGTLDSCPKRFESSKRATRRTLKAGDIVLEVSGGSSARGQTTGRSALITTKLLDSCDDTLIPASFCRLIRLRTENILPRYAYYHLQEMYASGRAGLYENQSTGISNFQFNYFLESEMVRLPNMGEQRRIAWVLGSLDYKIELNKRMARTLEDIAAAIFRARFIDFEGVEEFEDSELGPIPKGWKWGELDEIVTSTNEREGADEAVADAPYFGLDIMPRASTVLWTWDERSKVSGETRKFLPRDILFGKLRPYFKKVGVAPVAGSCSTEILVLRPDKDYWSLGLGHLTDDRFIEHCVAHSRGTKMPRSEWKDMKAYRVPIPPPETAAEMGAPIEVIYQQAECLVHETRTLSQLRDELLPRLISGQIRVPEGVGPESDVTEVAEELIEA
jgi:type I restriction enzyme S subunit